MKSRSDSVARQTPRLSFEPPPERTGEWNGVVPIQQARSEATYQALILAGRTALEDQSFQGLTIATLARNAGASVGAFYGRFENKQAYFSAIQETVVAEAQAHIRQRLDVLDAADADVAQFLCTIATIWASIFRDNKGLYRAAFKDSCTQPQLWTPFKRLGWHGAAVVTEKLLPRLAAMGRPSNERDIRIAMQFMNGMLVNATINDPGPIRLEDEEMVPYLVRLLCTFMGVEPPQAVPPSRKAATQRASRARAATSRKT